MSLTSRARAIHKQLPWRGYQEILEDLRKQRLRPEHDERYVRAWSDRHTRLVTCDNCDVQFPIGLDKKGYSDEAGREICDACRLEVGTSPCLRCGEELIGQDRESFCDSCQDYIDAQ
jgi:hypothetical protein